MLGGGTFLSHNKILPGAYINIVNASIASQQIGTRGTIALPIKGDWGAEGDVVEISSSNISKVSQAYFGYKFDADEMKSIRDLYLNAVKVYFVRCNGGEKASCAVATAKYSGTVGNKIIVDIRTNVDDADVYEVKTYLDTNLMDTQLVKAYNELVANDYVVFDKAGELADLAGNSYPMKDGTSETATADEIMKALAQLEKYGFNALGCVFEDEAIKNLYVTYTKRMRDEVGKKFQTVVHNLEADYEGVVNVINGLVDADDVNIVYYTTGIVGSCPINETNTNRKYAGEYVVNTDYTQEQLEEAIEKGKFVYHENNSEVYVLKDINSLTTTSETKGEDLKLNQVIRVVDEIANSIADLFINKFLGKVQNNSEGITLLKSAIQDYFTNLYNIRAIEQVSSDDIEVYKGETKTSVIANTKVTVSASMEQLYMTVNVF